MKYILETERLLLRELDMNDAPFILTLVNTPSWIKFIGDRNIHSIEDAKAYLKGGPMDSYKKNGYGLSAVVLKQTNIPIGMCGLVNRDSLKDVDIGFALMPEFTNRGYAFEIASATMSHAKDVLKIKNIVAITDPQNKPSIKLLNKLGLHFKEIVNLNNSEAVQLYTSEST